MKVLIADLPKAQNRNIDYEINLLKEAFPNVETVVYNYDESKKDEFKTEKLIINLNRDCLDDFLEAYEDTFC